MAAIRIDVTDFGATGNGNTDDTQAFQRAADAAVATAGTLVIPSATRTNIPATYAIEGTVTLRGSGPETYCDIEGQGGPVTILSKGSNKAVFRSYGWKRSQINRVNISVGAGASGVTGWDLNVESGRSSTGVLAFADCSVLAPSSTVDGLVGWETAKGMSSGSESSFITWRQCTVEAASAGTTGHKGWSINGSNTLNYAWYNCSGTWMKRVFTTNPGSFPGGDSHYFHGCGGSYNELVFELASAGAYQISGGRWELCNKLIAMAFGGSSLNLATLQLDGLKMNDFTLTDGKLIDLGLAANVRLGSCHLSLAEGQTPTAAMISLSTGASGFGSLDVAGCALPSGSPDSFWTIGGAGNWSVRVTGSCTVDRTGQTVARLTERAPA